MLLILTIFFFFKIYFKGDRGTIAAFGSSFCLRGTTESANSSATPSKIKKHCKEFSLVASALAEYLFILILFYDNAELGSTKTYKKYTLAHFGVFYVAQDSEGAHCA